MFDIVDGDRSGVVTHEAPRRLSGGYYDKAPHRRIGRDNSCGAGRVIGSVPVQANRELGRNDATSLAPRIINFRWSFVRFAQFALALSTLVLVSDLGAQAPLETAIRTLKPGQTVRIRVHGGDRIESRIRSLQAESLPLQLVGDSAAFDVAAIDSLWVRGRATRTGAIVGAAVVGVASFAYWAALCTALSDGQGCKDWGHVTAYSVAGAGVGALIGAAVGAIQPKWRLRYARALPGQGTMMRLPLGRLGLGVAYAVGW